MDKKNNNVIVIILLIIIIIILGGLVFLVASGKISFTTTSSENNDYRNGVITDDKNINKDNEEDLSIYNEVINQYSEIINSNLSDDYDCHADYNYVFYESSFAKNIKALDWYFAYYDINGDGVSELFVSHILDQKHFVDVIYSNKKNNIVKLSNYMTRNYLYGIYDNGMIISRGSGSALLSGYEFGTINDSLSLDKISCTIEYDNTGSIVSIGCNNNDMNFTSSDELINYYVDDANNIDIEKLNWQKIN